MILSAPAWLALLALVPLIVLLHLRRRAPVEVPSVRLWRLVADGSEPTPRLTRPPPTLALWLQLAALATLALALAGPTWGPSAEPRRLVVVVDGGAAMGVRDHPLGPTRFERALDEVAALARPPGSELEVWWAGPDPHPIAIEAVGAAAIARASEGLRPADAAPDWGATADAIARSLAGADGLVVLTADPTAAMAALADAAGGHEVEVDVRSLAAPFDNLALEGASIRQLDVPGRWRVEGFVRTDGAVPARGEAPQLVATFMPDGATTPLPFGRRDLAFSQAGTARPLLTLDLPGPGLLTLALEGSDAVAGDDTLRYHLDPDPSPVTVAVLSEGSGEAPLVRALEAAGARVLRTPRWPLLEPVDLLVIDGVGDPWLGAGAALPRPDAVVWIGTAPGVADASALGVRDPGVAGWSTEHAVTRGTSWSSLGADVALDLPPLDGAVTLVHGVTGPLVQVRTRSTGRDVVVALPSRDPGWTGTAGFVTFVVDLIDWLAPRRDEVWSCTVGVPCHLPLAVVASGGAHTDGGGPPRWRWPGSGSLPTGVNEAWLPHNAGAWRTELDGAVSWIPVNPAPGAAGLLRSASAAGADAVRPPAGTQPARGNLVRAFVALAALIALIEGGMAGRGRDAFWSPRSWFGLGPGPARRRATAALHAAAVLLLALAAFGAPWPRLHDDRHVVVVTSSELDAAALPEPLSAWPGERRTDVILEQHVGSAVDLESAVRRGLASVGAGGDVRIVLAPPAGQTRGRLEHLLGTLRAQDVPVDLLPPPRAPDGDVVVERVWLDRRPRAGDAAALHAAVLAPHATSARLRLHRDGQLEAELDIDLPAGRSLVHAPLVFDEPGPVRFEVEVVAPDDPRRDNDRASVVVSVAGAPVVHVVGAADAAAAFGEALALQGYVVEARAPQHVGVRPGEFIGVDGVVLVDVPALDLTSSQLDALEAYVRDLGGGLVITGGERSFGPGGYYQTVLDRLSPLGAQVPRDAPEVAMLFVLDRSGSMQQLVGSATRLEIAKQATLTAVELLGDRSQVAVIVFDEEATVLLPFTSSADRGAIEAALAHLVPGGGTAIYPGLVLASRLLESVDAATRHVLVMTDGLSQPGDFPGAVAAIVALEATVSTVAIGVGADAERIREIARLGGGTAHVTTDFRALPSILAQEAMLVSGDPVVRERVVPRRAQDASGLLTDLPEVFPPLEAFVETTAKEAADVILEDAEGRPLLAAWRYGAGRVLAFGSHVAGPWAGAWTESAAFPHWWGQWLRWTAQPAVTPELTIHAYTVGDELLVDVVALTIHGGPASGLALEASIEHEGGRTTARLARERAPGRYEARLPLEVGSSVVHVGTVAGSGPHAVQQVGVHHAYPAALSGGGDPEELSAFAAATGGRVLVGPDAAWTFPGRARVVASPAVRPWALLGLVAWLVCLVLRYAPEWLRLGRFSSRGRRARPPSSPAGAA